MLLVVTRSEIFMKKIITSKVMITEKTEHNKSPQGQLMLLKLPKPHNHHQQSPSVVCISMLLEQDIHQRRNTAGCVLAAYPYLLVLYFLCTPVSFPLLAFMWNVTIIFAHSNSWACV